MSESSKVYNESIPNYYNQQSYHESIYASGLNKPLPSMVSDYNNSNGYNEQGTSLINYAAPAAEYYAYASHHTHPQQMYDQQYYYSQSYEANRQQTFHSDRQHQKHESEKEGYINCSNTITSNQSSHSAK